MRKILLLLMVFIGFVMNAQEKKPVIEFKEEVIDYGTIKKGDNGLRVFEFTNTGDAPLIITDAYSSCNCTIPSVPKNTPIAPGESGKIEVLYDTKILGTIRKTITIITNASENPIALRIKGKVVE